MTIIYSLFVLTSIVGLAAKCSKSKNSAKVQPSSTNTTLAHLDSLPQSVQPTLESGPEPRAAVPSTAERVQTALGPVSFVQLADGIQGIVMSFPVLHFSHSSASAQSVVASVIAGLCMFYYVLLGWRLLKVASTVWPKCQGQTLGNLQTLLANSGFSAVGALFAQNGWPKRRIDLLMPLIYMVRSALISISVFLLSRNPSTQVWLAAVVEWTYLLLVIITRVKSTKKDNIAALMQSFLPSTFLALKAVLTKKSLVLEFGTAGVVLVIFVLNILRLLGLAMKLLVGLFSLLLWSVRAFFRSRCPKRKVSLPSSKAETADTLKDKSSSGNLSHQRNPNPMTSSHYAAEKQGLEDNISRELGTPGLPQSELPQAQRRVSLTGEAQPELASQTRESHEAQLRKQMQNSTNPLVSHKKKTKSGLLDINSTNRDLPSIRIDE